ncbi:MAG: phosphatidate cytidylyltransferase [Chthoniobacterales bacterium]
MSPTAALHDPVFRAYLVIVFGLLVGAGIVLALLHFVSRVELGGVWKTYRSWLWLAPLVALAIFAGRVPFIAGVTAVALFAFREFGRVSGLAGDRWMCGAAGAGIVSVGMWALIGQGLEFAALGALLLPLVGVLRNRNASVPAGIGVSRPTELQSLSLGLIAFVYLGWMFGHLAFLANAPSAYGCLCYLIFATEAGDVAAFTFGKMFGRHPLRSAISPGKTWEGSLGALALSLALPFLLRFSFPRFGTRQLILTGLIVGVGGQLGDLALSMIKRELGAKDWSAAIPGHGGILDRIDSLVFVAPLFIEMTGYYHPGR